MGSPETWTDPRPLGHTFLKPSQMSVVLWTESCNSRHIIYSGDTPALLHTTPYVLWRPQNHLAKGPGGRSVPSERGLGRLAVPFMLNLDR